MKTILSFVGFALLFSILSCSKKDAPAIPTITVMPTLDTLTTGWKKIVFDKTEDFQDISFNTISNGFLVGNKTYKSVDGGLHWVVILDHPFINLAVTDNGNAFFAGAKDTIYKTSNGVNTFTSFPINSSVYTNYIFFVDNNIGFFTNYENLMSTTDGGASWTKINTNNHSGVEQGASIFFLNINNGFIVNNQSVNKTDGSTSKWVPASFLGTPPEFLQVVFAPSANTVYLTSAKFKLYKSIDAGSTFSEIKSFPHLTGFYCNIYFLDDNNGYFSGGNKIYKTTDGGMSWSTVATLGDNGIFYGIHFTDLHHGWACGSNGVVLLYNN